MPGQSLVVKEMGFDVTNKEAFIDVVDKNSKEKTTHDIRIWKPNKTNCFGLTSDEIKEKRRLWDLAKAHAQCMFNLFEFN